MQGFPFNLAPLTMHSILLQRYFAAKKVAILGFGREGRSSYKWLRGSIPELPIFICDRNPAIGPLPLGGAADCNTTSFLGENYLAGLKEADIIIKSPGIPLKQLEGHGVQGRISSQTELFLEFFRKQVAGITGTKGKSTTASLLRHMLMEASMPSVLVGNIGLPCFEALDAVGPDTCIVFEMSSHQLQDIGVSPHIAVLLNIFEEHLDHYASYEAYQQAKLNIARWQQPDDFLIFDPENPAISNKLAGIESGASRICLGRPRLGWGGVFCESGQLNLITSTSRAVLPDACINHHLPGQHNLQNIKAAAASALLFGAKAGPVTRAVASFWGLPHRLEYLGSFGGVEFVNDSIATIPEATMEAVRSFPGATTLILGGADRGVSYDRLMDFLASSQIGLLVFTGNAGRRMLSVARGVPGFEGKHCKWEESFDQAVLYAVRNTPRGGLCLLSPAAASYNAFRDFEQRGQRFRELIVQRVSHHGKPQSGPGV